MYTSSKKANKRKQRAFYHKAKQRYQYLAILNALEDSIYQYAQFAQVIGALSIILSIYTIITSSYIGLFFSVGCMAAAITSLYRMCQKVKEIKSIKEKNNSLKT